MGISAYYHDSAACLLGDSKILAAAQEERFTRIKHDSSFPQRAIEYCCSEANIQPTEIDCVGYYEKPNLKFDRIIKTFEHYAPRGFDCFYQAVENWIGEKSKVQEKLVSIFGSAEVHYNEHHGSHAMSAFYPSPFEDAAILTIDGVGEWATSTLSHGQGSKVDIIKELRFPHSVGLLYSAFTAFSGFRVNSGEYKVMGLAPYGRPKYVDKILNELIDLKEDGSLRLNLDYFTFPYSQKMSNEKFEELFDGPMRSPESKLTQREMDLAKSVQVVVEKIVLRMARYARQLTGSSNLCLAGGVALNCVANGKLSRAAIFDNIWVQPASGDAGGALGSAYGAYFKNDKHERSIQATDSMNGTFLGPEFNDAEVQAFLDKKNIKYRRLCESSFFSKVAELISEGKVVGWFQGRMEYGPRALGNRSILADPRSPKMQKVLNLKIKYRESFRPFAPSVLSEDVSEWFEHDSDSPYMLLVADVKEDKRRAMTSKEKALFGIDKLNVPRSSVPAITHVDYSARIQTVHADTNPRYHALISKFKEKTGCPLVVNTSFNVRGEPIICSPTDAFKCFMGTELDVLAVGNFILYKEQQNEELKENYENRYELD